MTKIKIRKIEEIVHQKIGESIRYNVTKEQIRKGHPHKCGTWYNQATYINGAIILATNLDENKKIYVSIKQRQLEYAYKDLDDDCTKVRINQKKRNKFDSDLEKLVGQEIEIEGNYKQAWELCEVNGLKKSYVYFEPTEEGYEQLAKYIKALK